MIFYCFYYYDSIVYYQTDCQNHSKCGQGVNSKAKEYEGSKGTNQGYGNCQQRNQSCTPVTQEDEYYENYQHKCFEEGVCYFFQGFNDKLSFIHDNKQFHVIRETSFCVSQSRLNIGNGFNSVSIRSQRNCKYCSFTAINGGANHVITRAFINGSNIFQFQVVATSRANDDIAKFFRSSQTTLSTCRISFFLHCHSRSITDGAYCRLNVLSFNCIRNIINSYAKLSHFFRINPNTHCIFRSVFFNGRYTFYTFNCVDKACVSIGSQEHTVISTVRRNQAKEHNCFCCFFSSSYTVTHNFARQRAACLGYTVLNFYRSDVSVFVQVELYVKFVLTTRSTNGAHIQHVFNATYFLLDRLSNRFFYGISTSAYIVCRYCNTRLSNIRILCDR